MSYFNTPDRESNAGGPSRYETFSSADGGWDDNYEDDPSPSLYEIRLAMQARENAACLKCSATRETVSGDRRIRAAAVCCTEVA